MILKTNASCIITAEPKQSIANWLKDILEEHEIEPFFEIDHFCEGRELDVQNCELKKKKEVKELSGSHGGGRVWLDSCERPAVCFISEPLSGVEKGRFVDLSKEGKVRDARDKVKKMDIPQKLREKN